MGGNINTSDPGSLDIETEASVKEVSFELDCGNCSSKIFHTFRNFIGDSHSYTRTTSLPAESPVNCEVNINTS